MEEQLVTHCSPTLAGVKVSNLFNYNYVSTNELESHIEKYNNQLNEKGVFLEVLRTCKGVALVLLYRRQILQDELNRPEVTAFLSKYGYKQYDVTYCLDRLKQELVESEQFPHEIGIFLGYPLEDVIGFIENAGHNCKCCGCWKVYSDECEAIRLFELFKECKEVYKQKFIQGMTVAQLAVAA